MQRKGFPMKPLRVLALTLACAALPSFAQQVISAKSGLLSYVEGNVTLNGEPADFSGVHFSDVKENSVVRTADGRAEERSPATTLARATTSRSMPPTISAFSASPCTATGELLWQALLGLQGCT